MFLQPFERRLGWATPVRLVARPGLGQQKTPSRPPGLIGRVDAKTVADQLTKIAENAPECFEGEDLTAARALASRLKEFAATDKQLLDLSDEEERILKRGQSCFAAIERGAAPTGTATPGAVAPGAAGTTVAGLPVLPLAIGAGVGAVLVAILIS